MGPDIGYHEIGTRRLGPDHRPDARSACYLSVIDDLVHSPLGRQLT